jgi:hypothetical protein
LKVLDAPTAMQSDPDQQEMEAMTSSADPGGIGIRMIRQAAW